MSFVFMVVHWPLPEWRDRKARSMRAMGDTFRGLTGCIAVEPPLLTDDGERLIGVSHWTSRQAFLRSGLTMRPADEVVEGEGRPRARYLLEATELPRMVARASSTITSELVWRQLRGASFAIMSYVNPTLEPRSSGISYAMVGRRLYVAVSPDSWKARQIATGQIVSLVVPIRRGGLLASVLPIPPATISFRARVRVRPIGSVDLQTLPTTLARVLRELRYASNEILELTPEGRFLTYGIGVSLLAMRDSALAQASVPTDG